VPRLYIGQFERGLFFASRATPCFYSNLARPLPLPRSVCGVRVTKVNSFALNCDYATNLGDCRVALRWLFDYLFDFLSSSYTTVPHTARVPKPYVQNEISADCCAVAEEAA
jgi:hypothetical protein